MSARWSRRRLGRLASRALLGAAGGLVLLFLVVPVISVIPMSFSSSMVFELIPSDPGLTQYRRFFSSPEWMAALGRSAQVALGTTIVATIGCLVGIGVTARIFLMRDKRLATRPPVDNDRLLHLEQAVDAIAIEIERISEAQRFQTKLLSEGREQRAVGRG